MQKVVYVSVQRNSIGISIAKETNELALLVTQHFNFSLFILIRKGFSYRYQSIEILL